MYVYIRTYNTLYIYILHTYVYILVLICKLKNLRCTCHVPVADVAGLNLLFYNHGKATGAQSSDLAMSISTAQTRHTSGVTARAQVGWLKRVPRKGTAQKTRYNMDPPNQYLEQILLCANAPFWHSKCSPIISRFVRLPRWISDQPWTHSLERCAAASAGGCSTSRCWRSTWHW